jgi:hypothetical protein
MRTTITADHNYVHLHYDCVMTGQRIARTFFVPWSGGYVREMEGNGQSRQVCARLAYIGATLRATDPADLLRVVRAEYRAMRRAEQAEERRYA